MSKHVALTATRIYVVSAVGEYTFVCLMCSKNHSSFFSAAGIRFSPNAAARVYDLMYRIIVHFGGTIIFY